MAELRCHADADTQICWFIHIYIYDTIRCHVVVICPVKMAIAVDTHGSCLCSRLELTMKIYMRRTQHEIFPLNASLHPLPSIYLISVTHSISITFICSLVIRELQTYRQVEASRAERKQVKPKEKRTIPCVIVFNPKIKSSLNLNRISIEYIKYKVTFLISIQL